MGQRGCYDEPDSGFCEIPEGEPTIILECKNCFLTDCVRYGQSGFCAKISTDRGSGYIKNKSKY